MNILSFVEVSCQAALIVHYLTFKHRPRVWNFKLLSFVSFYKTVGWWWCHTYLTVDLSLNWHVYNNRSGNSMFWAANLTEQKVKQLFYTFAVPTTARGGCVKEWLNTDMKSVFIGTSGWKFQVFCIYSYAAQSYNTAPKWKASVNKQTDFWLFFLPFPSLPVCLSTIFVESFVAAIWIN